MKEIRKSSQFKKDFKRIRNDNDKVEALLNIVRLLERGGERGDRYMFRNNRSWVKCW